MTYPHRGIQAILQCLTGTQIHLTIKYGWIQLKPHLTKQIKRKA